MASPSSGGTSSGSSSLQQSASSGEEIHMQIMDERKRKRMESNRESARRSRMRKQKHLDDLMSQAANLRKTNTQLLDSINITTQHYAKIEAENSVLRAQMSELSSRLQSLNEISNVLSVNTHHNEHNSMGVYQGVGDKMEDFLPILQDPFAVDNFLMMNNTWSSTANSFNQPIMASAANNMFHY